MKLKVRFRVSVSAALNAGDIIGFYQEDGKAFVKKMD